MTRKQREQADAVTKLRTMLKPGDTVYTVLRHASRSGMTREIGLVLMQADQSNVTDLHPNHLVATALDYRVGKRDGLVVGGCGMDMGFSVVYNLGRKLFPDGFKVDGRGRNGDTSGWDNDGGYALKQRWL